MDYVHNYAQIGGYSSQSMPAIQVFYPEVSDSSISNCLDLPYSGVSFFSDSR